MLKLDLEHAKVEEWNVQLQWNPFFKELEFRSLIKSLERLTGKEVVLSLSPSSSPNAEQQMSMFGNAPQVDCCSKDRVRI